MKEKLEIRRNENQAYFKNSTVDEVVNTKNERAVYRVFENYKLGISYMQNNIEDETGYQLAEKNLKYDYQHTTKLNAQSNVIAIRSNINERYVGETVNSIGKKFSDKYPDIQIRYKNIKMRYTLTNVNKLHINFEDERNEFEVDIQKDRFTLNYRKSDENSVIEDIQRYIEPILNEESLDIKQCNDITKLIFPTNIIQIYEFFEKILSCENLLSNNLLEKELFSKKLNLYTSLAFEDSKSEKYGILPFFDWEGSYSPNYKTILIEEGKIIKPYSNKDMAKKYEVENTCCAYAVKDNYPNCNLLGAYIESTDTNLKDMLDKAILIEEVDLSIQEDILQFEVKKAYLYNNTKLTHKIKPFSFKVRAYDMYGKNFVGVSSDYLFNSDLRKAIVFDIDDNIKFI